MDEKVFIMKFFKTKAIFTSILMGMLFEIIHVNIFTSTNADGTSFYTGFIITILLFIGYFYKSVILIKIRKIIVSILIPILNEKDKINKEIDKVRDEK